jgi:hypothetical protein
MVIDGASVRMNSNALREYDIRHDLHRRGKLTDMPLEVNDFDLDPTAQLLERQLYSNPNSTQSAARESDSGGDENEINESATATEPTTTQEEPNDKDRHNDEPASDEMSGESDDDGNSIKITFGSYDEIQEKTPPPKEAANNETKRPRRKSTTNSSSDQDYATDSGMGRDAAAASKLGTPSSTDDNSPDDDSIDDQRLQSNLRRGPTPRTPRTRMPSLGNIELTDQDAGDIAMNDSEEEKYGPRTKVAINEARKKATSGPRHPRRSLRILPIGKACRHEEHGEHAPALLGERDTRD